MASKKLNRIVDEKEHETIEFLISQMAKLKASPTGMELPYDLIKQEIKEFVIWWNKEGRFG